MAYTIPVQSLLETVSLAARNAIELGDPLRAIDICVANHQSVPDWLLELGTQFLNDNHPDWPAYRIERYLNRVRIVITALKFPF